MSWYDKAACADMGIDLFFPTSGRGRHAPGVDYLRKVATAKAVCARCVVKAACLADAVENHDYGIRGGMTADEREVMLRRRRPAEAVCGTTGGYFRHARLGTETCADCRKAHASAERRRAAARAGRMETVPPHPRHGATP